MERYALLRIVPGKQPKKTGPWCPPFDKYPLSYLRGRMWNAHILMVEHPAVPSVNLCFVGNVEFRLERWD